jgi:hypothetical protein
MTDALFSINADSGDQGFDATPAQVLTLRLKTTPVAGVNSVRFQVWDAALFDRDEDIIRNPPRKAKGSADLVFDNGSSTGTSLSPLAVDGAVTLTMPGTRPPPGSFAASSMVA